MLSSPTFEWAVVAAVSIAAHLLERSYSLRFVDELGAPGLRRSVSAPWPEDEEFSGQTGLHGIAQGLAALDLLPDPTKRSTASQKRRAASPRPAHGRPGNGGSSTHTGAFGDPMLDKLAHMKNRGPLIALLGAISEAEARNLGPAAQYGSQAFAILISERPRDLHHVMDILRSAGWHVVAVTPKASVAAAWAHFDTPPITVTSSTAKTTLTVGTVGTGAQA
jgi:acetolactate synthase regulatory subunit